MKTDYKIKAGCRMMSSSVLGLCLLLSAGVLAQKTGYTSDSPSKSAQAVCTRSKADLPEINGVRFGMRSAEVRNLFLRINPDLKVSAEDANGYSEIATFATRTVPLVVDSNGVVYRKTYESLRVAFFEDAVYGIEKSYPIGVPTEPKWRTTSEFAAQISNAFKLDGEWVVIGRYPASIMNPAPQPKLAIDCRDFGIEVSFSSYDNKPFLSLVDNIALEKHRERHRENMKKREEENQRKKNVFKP